MLAFLTARDTTPRDTYTEMGDFMNIDPNTVATFARLMKQTASNGVDASAPAEVVPLTLTGIKPIKWRKGVELPLPSSCVVLPRGLGFDAADVGKTYLFLQARKGKRFFFMCESGVHSIGDNT